MIDSLTPEQEQRLIEIRERYFREATSVEPADRSRAEAAVCRIYELTGYARPECSWVLSPEAGKAEYERRAGKTCASPSSSLKDSFEHSLRIALTYQCSISINNSVSSSLRCSLCDSLWESLSDSLWDSLTDFFRASLRHSLWDSLSASGWPALFEFGGELVEYPVEQREWMRQFIELHASCFAVWAVPGWAVLCERPETVEVVDGKLVGLTWREHGPAGCGTAPQPQPTYDADLASVGWQRSERNPPMQTKVTRHDIPATLIVREADGTEYPAQEHHLARVLGELGYLIVDLAHSQVGYLSERVKTAASDVRLGRKP